MKKNLLLFSFVLLISGSLLISACGNKTDISKNQPPNEEGISDNSSNQPMENEHQLDEPEVDVVEPDVTFEEPVEEEKKISYQINPNNWKVEPIDDASKEVVLITIDDAPEKYAVEMARTLKSLDAPAIFFVNGHFLDTPEEEEMLREIHEMGFAIGNHTYSHPKLNALSEEDQRNEIVSLSDRVEEIIGERPVFFRAPHGINTDISQQIVREQGMVPMNWSYGYDWEAEYQESEALADIMLNTPLLSSGANLLMHDRAWTYGALTAIVEGLREKGYELADPWTIETGNPIQED